MFDRFLAKFLPWDEKLDRIESKLGKVESLLESTMAQLGRCITDRDYIEEMFSRAHGYLPDLDHPLTFNEKLAWTKLNRLDPIYADLTDKSRCKVHVERLLGREFLIESICELDSVNELEFAALPNRFVLKPSHGSGWTLIVWNKASADVQSIKRKLHVWMSTNYYRFQRESQYRPLRPKLIVERLLLDAQGLPPADYKLHCFHGKVVYIQVDSDRHTNHRRTFYDRNWVFQPFQFAPADAEGSPRFALAPEVPPPVQLGSLLQTAEKLAAPFEYVRVDLYLADEKVLFGELTFSPGAAVELFFPRKWDLFWGHLWRLEPSKHPPMYVAPDKAVIAPSHWFSGRSAGHFADIIAEGRARL
jgi:hypothetical protein